MSEGASGRSHARVVEQVDLPDREVVGGAPVRIEVCELVRGERTFVNASHHDLLEKRETQNGDGKEGSPADDRRGPQSRAEWGSGLDVLVDGIITTRSSICPLSRKGFVFHRERQQTESRIAAGQVTRR